MYIQGTRSEIEDELVTKTKKHLSILTTSSSDTSSSIYNSSSFLNQSNLSKYDKYVEHKPQQAETSSSSKKESDDHNSSTVDEPSKPFNIPKSNNVYAERNKRRYKKYKAKKNRKQQKINKLMNSSLEFACLQFFCENIFRIFIFFVLLIKSSKLYLNTK